MKEIKKWLKKLKAEGYIISHFNVREAHDKSSISIQITLTDKS